MVSDEVCALQCDECMSPESWKCMDCLGLGFGEVLAAIIGGVLDCLVGIKGFFTRFTTKDREAEYNINYNSDMKLDLRL